MGWKSRKVTEQDAWEDERIRPAEEPISPVSWRPSHLKHFAWRGVSLVLICTKGNSPSPSVLTAGQRLVFHPSANQPLLCSLSNRSVAATQPVVRRRSFLRLFFFNRGGKKVTVSFSPLKLLAGTRVPVCLCWLILKLDLFSLKGRLWMQCRVCINARVCARVRFKWTKVERWRERETEREGGRERDLSPNWPTFQTACN